MWTPTITHLLDLLIIKNKSERNLNVYEEKREKNIKKELNKKIHINKIAQLM